MQNHLWPDAGAGTLCIMQVTEKLIAFGIKYIITTTKFIALRA